MKDMNVDRIIRISPSRMAAIVRGRKTETRIPVVPEPGPSDSPDGCGFLWYPDEGTRSCYAWAPDLDSLLVTMVDLGHSPFGRQGETLGFVADHGLGGPWEGSANPMACKSVVIRSWIHRLIEVTYDSCIRMGYEPPESHRRLSDVDGTHPALAWLDARDWLLSSMSSMFGGGVVRPDRHVWACQFEVTEVLRP
jgi:hypothetical protein